MKATGDIVTQTELFDKIPQILERFNFQKVHEHMVRVDHKWVNGDSYEVPSIEDLRATARRLLIAAALDPRETINHGTGGLMAYKLPWGISLTFQLAWA